MIIEFKPIGTCLETRAIGRRWVKHLKPVRELGMDKKKQALKDCYIRPYSLGLIEEWKITELAKFS